jgi:hypothetical protein
MSDSLLNDLSRFIGRLRSNLRSEYGILPGATADRLLLGNPTAGAGRHGAGSFHGQACAEHDTGPARRDTMMARSTACDNRTIRLSHDANNCGRLGVECDPGEICLAGVCRPGRSRFSLSTN